MGTLVDKTTGRKLGKCRTFLLVVPCRFLYAHRNVFHTKFGFYDPACAVRRQIAVIIVWLFITYRFGSLLTPSTIPLWGREALMSEDEKDRSKPFPWLVSRRARRRHRPAVGAARRPRARQKIRAAFRSAEKVSSAAAGERMGFIAAAFLFGVVGCALFQLAGIFVRERIPASEEAPPSRKTSV